MGCDSNNDWYETGIFKRAVFVLSQKLHRDAVENLRKVSTVTEILICYFVSESLYYCYYSSLLGCGSIPSVLFRWYNTLTLMMEAIGFCRHWYPHGYMMLTIRRRHCKPLPP
jgi:hypothetical protein